MHAGDIYRIAGTGSCGQVADGGISTDAELWDPVDVAIGPAGDVVVSDAGAEEVLDLAPRTGRYYGTSIRTDHLAIVAGLGFYSAYLIDGLPATGQTAELNSPSDIAVTKSGDLLISNTYSSCIREVPSTAGTELGVNVAAGDMYTLGGALLTGPGASETTWVGPHMLYPVGIAVAPDGSVLYSDQGANVVPRAISAKLMPGQSGLRNSKRVTTCADPEVDQAVPSARELDPFCIFDCDRVNCHI